MACAGEKHLACKWLRAGEKNHLHLRNGFEDARPHCCASPGRSYLRGLELRAVVFFIFGGMIVVVS